MTVTTTTTRMLQSRWSKYAAAVFLAGTSSLYMIGARNKLLRLPENVSRKFMPGSGTFVSMPNRTHANVSSVEASSKPPTPSSTTEANATSETKDLTAELHAWCVIDKNNMSPHFRHFPHTMQSLAPCWSYFIRVRQKYAKRGVEVKCGLFLNQTTTRWPEVKVWAQQLVDAWNCTVVHDQPPSDQFREHWRHGSGWFAKSSDADQMRDKVLGDFRRRATGNVTEARNVSRIGIVQRFPPRARVPSRLILNADEIIQLLHRDVPAAMIELTDMKGMSMLDQARWWNRQDVIVLAHGAAVTNVIFMEPRTSSVVEIYPDRYAPYMFRALMRSCSVRSYAILKNTSATPPFHGHPRNVDLRPDDELVVSLVQDAIARAKS